MSNHGFFDEPDRDEMMMKAMDRAEPEHYQTERAAREAHQMIEELSRPKKRETPPEVVQAHRIGLLEGQLSEAKTRAYEEHDRANTLEQTVQAQAETIVRLNSDLERVQRDSNVYSQDAAKYKKLHTDLLNKRRYR